MGVRFVCERCAICCGDTKERIRQILLLKTEAKHVSEKTSKDIEEFAQKVKGSEPYVYRMRKTDGGKCVFLKDTLCSIYTTRPLICKFYPFQLKNTKSGKLVFTYTNECPGIGKGPKLKRNFFQKLFKESERTMVEDTSESDKKY